jgi:hypothetical protein
MAKIFSNNLNGTNALVWWMQLNIYKEGMRDGKQDFEAPGVCLTSGKS